jgi:hypothetical protein
MERPPPAFGPSCAARQALGCELFQVSIQGLQRSDIKIGGVAIKFGGKSPSTS